MLRVHSHAHGDGRVSYPIAFLVFLPGHVPVQLKVLYTRAVGALCTAFAVGRHIALDDADDLDDDWLEAQLSACS